MTPIGLMPVWTQRIANDILTYPSSFVRASHAQKRGSNEILTGSSYHGPQTS